MEVNNCGNCTMCCKVLAVGMRQDTIEEETGKILETKILMKSANVWCKHCEVGKGCGIYATRPEPCREFKCLYIQALEKGEKIGVDMRPDHTKVVFGSSTDGSGIVAYVDMGFPTAWRREPVWSKMKKMAANVPVFIVVGKKFFRFNRDGSAREAVMSEPDEKGHRKPVGYK